MIPNGPVHWLENIDGDPHRVRTACRMLMGGNRECWSNSDKPLDPNRTAIHPVTCPACLAAMDKQRKDREMNVPSFTNLMATNPARIEVMFRRGPNGEEQFQWGMTETRIPILTAIGLIVVVQGELPLLEPGDARHTCDRSSLVIVWDAAKKSMRWFVGPDVPLYPLLGILETMKDLLISSQLAQRAVSNRSAIVGPDGSPMTR